MDELTKLNWRAFRKGIALLDIAVPELIELHRSLLETVQRLQGPSGALECLRAGIITLEQLSVALSNVRAGDFHFQDLAKAYSEVPVLDHWHKFAGELADAVSEAMRSTNKGTEFGLGDTGPVARFLEVLIPLITGEAPTASAIARHLQRERMAATE